MTQVKEDTGVHVETSREPTTTVTARIPVSLLHLVQAVQAQDRDEDRNETLNKAIRTYVQQRLSAA